MLLLRLFSVAAICGDNEYALVLEDDARFIYGPSAGLSQIVEKATSIDAGLVFVNDRSSQQLPFSADPDNFELVPLDDIRTIYEPNHPRRDPGWGADGYLLDGKTAKHLCDIWLEIGLDGALDWQLYLAGQKNLDTISMAPRYRGALEGLRESRARDNDRYFCNGYVSQLSIITQEDYGYSTINSGHI